MNDKYFKISIIDGAINICQHLKVYPDITVEDAIRHLKCGPSHLACFDYENARNLGDLVGWNTFDVTGTRQYQLRKILMILTLVLKPFWARVSHLGRMKVCSLLSDDQLQCLKFAGLLDENITDEILSWWEQLSKVFRAADDEQKLEVGKKGELLTYNREIEILEGLGINKKPRVMSAEDSTAGYDILSYRIRNGEVIEWKIEVKAFTYGLPHFYITRNEWDVACKDRGSHILNIWNLKEQVVIEMAVDELQQHIPNDNGYGKWQNVFITLSL